MIAAMGGVFLPVLCAGGGVAAFIAILVTGAEAVHMKWKFAVTDRRRLEAENAELRKQINGRAEA